MNTEDLHPISYRGIEFFVTSTDTSGGRKVAIKRPLNSDSQIVEDFGKLPRSFSITGIIADRLDNSGHIIRSYKDVRDSLLDALELGDTGILIHPFYGRIEDVAVVTWSLNENITRLGEATISIEFGISDSDGVPAPTTSVLSQVNTQTLLVSSSAVSVIGSFATTFANNFQDGLDKLSNFVSDVNSAITDIIGITPDKLNSWSADLADLTSDAAGLVNSPSLLATSIVNIISGINDLEVIGESPLSSTKLDAYKKLFSYGDSDLGFKEFTAESIERANNNRAINTSIQSTALAYAYLNASKLKYETVESVIDSANSLEDQYQKVSVIDDIDSDLLDNLTTLRTITQEFFDDQKLESRQTVRVYTPPTSTRLLAYQNYGSSDLGEKIAELNSFGDLAYVTGDVKVFTE